APSADASDRGRRSARRADRFADRGHTRGHRSPRRGADPSRARARRWRWRCGWRSLDHAPMARVVRELPAEGTPACGAIGGATPLWERAGLGAERAAGLLASAAAGGDTVLVLEVDDVLAGFAWIDRRGAFGRSAYLRMIAIDPARRSSGLGAVLMGAFD